MTDNGTQNDTALGALYAPFVEGGLACVDAAMQWGALLTSLPSRPSCPSRHCLFEATCKAAVAR